MARQDVGGGFCSRAGADNYCNNCCKRGHSFYKCTVPITSLGVVVFREHPELGIQYLMIRRKDTLGFIDFMRGHYSVRDRKYVLNMIRQMTDSEKMMLRECDFDKLWARVWGEYTGAPQYNSTKENSRDKFLVLKSGKESAGGSLGYTLLDLLQDSCMYDCWTEAEWGFPKGRRNFQERDLDCALREMSEETGYSAHSVDIVKNIQPFEEIFIGSNYRAYIHKYFLMHMSYSTSLVCGNFEVGEVSIVEWKSYKDCMLCIRNYNPEKTAIIQNVHKTLTRHRVVITSDAGSSISGGGESRY
jgi:ADP-ribose pyrophosphatase YjhB (NUDIX family)